MKLNRKQLFKLVPVAATMATLGLGLSGNAQAAVAYSDAYLQVTNLVITANPAVIAFTSTADNSAASACLPNATCVNQGGAGFTDSPAAQIGIALANNTYTQQGVLAGSYSRADASIDSQQILGQPFTSARAISEGSLVSTNTANANSGNSSGSTFTSTFTVGGPGATLNFAFDADPFIEALLSGAVQAGSQADATISVSLNITDSAGNTVFDWSPDGNTGGITGGTENADAFSLNTSKKALPLVPGPLVYDPSNCAVGSIGTGCFNATTNNLAAGNYVLNLSMGTRNNLVLKAPEPGTVALLGISLAGFGLARRRQKKA